VKMLQLFGFGDTNTLLTTAFRKLGYDCDALFSNRAFVTQMPEWTRKHSNLDHGVYHWDSSNLYDPRAVADLYKFVRNYDFLFVHPPGGAYAWNIGRPFVVWDGGSGNIIFDSSKKQRQKDNLTHEIARRSYKKADWIFYNDIDVIYRSFSRMKWKHERYCYMPLPVDTELFRPLPSVPFPTFTAYLPTRQEVHNKGIDIILQGWRLFIQHVPDAQLLIAKFGSDVPITEFLIREYELTNNVMWVPLVKKPKLVELMNKADVVIDQARRGVLGGIADQALSCSKQVICAIHQPWYEEWLGEAPPVFSAWSPEQICKHLLRVREMNEPNRKGRRFILRHFEYMTVAKKTLKILEEIYN
jgi:glycosyltransferase involved in cell wall biosynthesis